MDKGFFELKDFKINYDEFVGKGQYGIVYKASKKDNPNQNLVVKILQQSNVNQKFLTRELEILKKLKEKGNECNNLVHIEDVIKNEEKGEIYIFMEHCDQDLKALMDYKIKNQQIFTQNEVVQIMNQVLTGYKFLHTNNIIHRDIKPANILLKNGVYKLADFGMGRILDDVNKKKQLTKVGTPAYAAPQLFFENQFSYKCDIYSFGVMFYQLIYGQLPLPNKNMNELVNEIKKIKENPIQCPQKEGISDNLRQLIQSMLTYAEENRIDIDSILKNPFFLKNQKSK